MAKAKTSSFILTERISLPAGTLADAAIGGTVDLGSYVDVADRQAISIESVDYVFQDVNVATGVISGGLAATWAGNASVDAQVTDLNRGTVIVFANDRALVSSGTLNVDIANNIYSMDADIYPDNYGPTSEQGTRLVVNDQLYLTAMSTVDVAAGHDLSITARITCKVVSLNTKDWMAIAIQSTAADN